MNSNVQNCSSEDEGGGLHPMLSLNMGYLLWVVTLTQITFLSIFLVININMVEVMLCLVTKMLLVNTCHIYNQLIYMCDDVYLTRHCGIWSTLSSYLTGVFFCRVLLPPNTAVNFRRCLYVCFPHWQTQDSHHYKIAHFYILPNFLFLASSFLRIEAGHSGSRIHPSPPVPAADLDQEWRHLPPSPPSISSETANHLRSMSRSR